MISDSWMYGVYCIRYSGKVWSGQADFNRDCNNVGTIGR